MISPSSIILNINDLHYRSKNFSFIKIISSQDISPWYPCCMWQDEQSSGCQTYRLYSPSSSLSLSLPHPHLNLFILMSVVNVIFTYFQVWTKSKSRLCRLPTARRRFAVIRHFQILISWNFQNKIDNDFLSHGSVNFLVMLINFVTSYHPVLPHIVHIQQRYLGTPMSTLLTTWPTPSMGWVSISPLCSSNGKIQRKL